VNRTATIYTSGLFAPDAVEAIAEVRGVFRQLEDVLSQCDSDFKHLAKATYYCSTSAASQKLNEIRPSLYDPKRPPSASKAMVRSVGHKDCNWTLDMIAVPKGK
jgi:enamine deaminase RidA (YjgF/YER057c/UK114 family)